MSLGKKGSAVLTRREFLKRTALAGFGFAGLAGCSRMLGATRPESALHLTEPSLTPTVKRIPSRTPVPPHEMRFYRALAESRVQCEVCFRKCVIRPERVGFCRTVKNVGGRCVSLAYGQPCAMQVDPIGKEPAFHVLPGTTIFCTATASCNYRCKFCQNWEFAQQSLGEVLSTPATPEEVVAAALEQECQAVSFTYNDPIVFYDYMFDIAQLARKKGLKSLLHTNGSLTLKAMAALLEVMDAIVVDLKGFTNEFYQRIVQAELMPVLDALQVVKESGKHLELVNLVVPTLNDDPGDIQRMCEWIVQNLGEQTPIHFLRFFPAYKLQRLPATPVETLERAAAIAGETGLHYVYVGNVPGHERNSTFCPKCAKRIIERIHFFVDFLGVEEGKCCFCGHPIPGVWA